MTQRITVSSQTERARLEQEAERRRTGNHGWDAIVAKVVAEDRERRPKAKLAELDARS